MQGVAGAFRGWVALVGDAQPTVAAARVVMNAGASDMGDGE